MIEKSVSTIKKFYEEIPLDEEDDDDNDGDEDDDHDEKTDDESNC